MTIPHPAHGLDARIDMVRPWQFSDCRYRSFRGSDAKARRQAAPRLTIQFARQGEVARLLRDDPRFDVELRAFLPRTYNLKAIADYHTGPGSHISAESAREAIDTARRFVEWVTILIPRNGQTPARTPETPKP
jgi:hypothetical protein